MTVRDYVVLGEREYVENRIPRDSCYSVGAIETFSKGELRHPRGLAGTQAHKPVHTGRMQQLC